ncbi:MAG: hypothetical protein ACFFC0_06895 [Promethearchaeota archaeon]
MPRAYSEGAGAMIAWLVFGILLSAAVSLFIVVLGVMESNLIILSIGAVLLLATLAATFYGYRALYGSNTNQ